MLSGLGDQLGFDVDTPWKKLPAKARKAILEGCDEQVHVRYKNRYGRTRSYYADFEGVMAFLHRRMEQTDSEQMKERLEGFMRDVPCPECDGTRLKPEILAVTMTAGEFGAKSIAQVCRAVDRRVRGVPQRAHPGVQGSRPSPVRCSRRSSHGWGSCSTSGWSTCRCRGRQATLSGGEAQRIRLATQIGSGLVGVLYVLDEPSIGLHQRDNRRLIDTLVRLRDLGNTLIVVEHDLDTIAHADWVVDIGPAAGEHGGQIVHSGTYEDLLNEPEFDYRRLSFGQGADRGPAAAAGRRPEAPAHRRRCARAQPARDRRGLPARRAHLGDRRVRIGQVDAGQRHPGVGAGQQAQRRPAGARSAHPGRRGWTSSTSWSASTSHRSAGRRGPTRPPTPGCSTRSARCSRRPPRPRSGDTSPAGSRSTSRAAGARPARVTAPSRSR